MSLIIPNQVDRHTRQGYLDKQSNPDLKQYEPLDNISCQAKISSGRDVGIDEPMPFLYFTLNTTGHILAVSAEVAPSLGYSVDLLLEQSIYVLLTASEQSKLQSQIDKTLCQSGHSQNQYELICHNGARLQVTSTVQHLQANHQEPVLLLVCEQSQGQVRHRLDQYQTLIESINGIVWQADIQTCELCFVSQQAERLLGYPIQLWLGQPNFWWEHIHPDDREEIRHEYHRAIQAGCNLELEYRIITSAGQTIWVQDTATVVIENDQPAFMVGVMREITQRKYAEFALSQQAKLQVNQVAIALQQSAAYQQVQQINIELARQVHAQTAELRLAFEFEATLKRITDKVRDSLDEHQILQTVVQEMVLAIGVKCCNAALYNREQRTSTVCYEYTTSISPYQGRVSRLDAFPEIYDQLLQGQSFQFCSLVPNPVRGRVAMLACPILDDQGALGDLWLINHAFYAFSEQDIRLVRQVANQCAIAIRQARLYQAAQIQVQELEKLNRLKDDFLSTVSHELRTPMSSIKMATQMLEVVLQQEGQLEAQAERAARYFQILHEECQREIGLINDLLDLSQLEARTEPLRPSAIDLKTWLPSVIQPFVNRVQRQQQQLQTDFLTELPSLVTDASSLQRILTELLDNACKYTPRGGQITITAQMIAPDLRAAPTPDQDTCSMLASGEILLSVQNSGVEIPSAEQSRIFDKFYRIPNPDPWQHGGIGMGAGIGQGTGSAVRSYHSSRKSSQAN